MGLWQATIVGIGKHDVDVPESSDRLIAAAVAQLRAAGHTIIYAGIGAPTSFTISEQAPGWPEPYPGAASGGVFCPVPAGELAPPTSATEEPIADAAEPPAPAPES